MPSCVLPCIWTAAWALVSSTTLQASDDRVVGDLALYGNERILWICQQHPQTDGAKLLRFAYRETGERGQRTETPAAGRFKTLPLKPIVGRIALATVRGNYLHIFYQDGSHHRFSPPSAPSSLTPGTARTVELILPGRALPQAIAADQVRNRLYALITARQAEKIPRAPTAEGADGTAAIEAPPLPDADQQPNEASGTDTAQDTPETGNLDPESHPQREQTETNASDLVLVRYAGGRWELDRDAPVELTVECTVQALLARDGVIHVVYQPAADTAPPVHRVSTVPEEPWYEAALLPVTATAVPLASGWADQSPVLLYGEDRASGLAVRPLRYIDDKWESASLLLDESHEPVILSDPAGVSFFNGKIAVARLDDQRKVQLGQWSTDGGGQLEPLVEVDVFARESQLRAKRLVRSIVPWIVLATLLGFVFVWRRESVVQTVPLGSGWTIARLQHRAGALFIDITIISPLWAPAVFALWRTGAPELPAMEQLMATGGEAPPAMIWMPAIIGGILGVYATIFEVAMGATPGKRITGCAVVGQDGERCGVAAILIRNAVRALEFHFAAVAILVLLTPNRQRLGDILARTLVVQAAPAPPPTPSDPNCDEEA